MSEAGQKLAAAGADFLIIGANTMHLVLDEVRARVPVPVLSLLDALVEAIQARGFRTVGLLGTRFTMEKPFYREALARHGIEVLLPNAEDRAYVNRVIYDELVAGQIRDESRQGYLRVVEELRQRGAEAVILGCTEIPLLVGEADAGLPLFDTTALHAEAALRYALGER